MTSVHQECLKPDVMRACGLVAFAYVACVAPFTSTLKRVIATIIVINGLLCHLTQQCVWERVDVLFNVCMVAIVNLTSRHKLRALTRTLAALLVWRFVYGRRERAWLHVAGVQWLLASELLEW